MDMAHRADNVRRWGQSRRGPVAGACRLLTHSRRRPASHAGEAKRWPRAPVTVDVTGRWRCASFSGPTKKGSAKVYDTIIVGGGSAGSVMAHRLSARSANKVLLCEAGQDTPPGNEPPEIRDSYPGTAYFDPRFHWTELKVTTQVVSHNNPGEARPPLRKYEQARVLGGGSSINGQMANRGAPTDYDECEARGASGWNWSQ